MDYGLLDLLDSNIRELIEQSGMLKTDRARKTIQLNLSSISMNMIDILHVITCCSPDCKYCEEETLEDTWSLPAHIEMTDLLLHIMNTCGVNQNNYTNVFQNYLKLTRLRIETPEVIPLAEMLLFKTTPMPAHLIPIHSIEK